MWESELGTLFITADAVLVWSSGTILVWFLPVPVWTGRRIRPPAFSSSRLHHNKAPVVSFPYVSAECSAECLSREHQQNHDLNATNPPVEGTVSGVTPVAMLTCVVAVFCLLDNGTAILLH